MLDLDKIAPRVLESLRKFLSRPNRSPNQIDKLIKEMSPREAFDSYLKYNGIIGYTEQIINALDSIRASEIKER